MKAINTIAISDILGKTLNTREAVQDISTLIEANPCQVIELDFSEIEFMSRSFADELHKERLRLQEQLPIKIEILNAAEEIIKILQAVARTQNKTDRKIEEVPVFKFSRPELISDYLLSI